MSAIYQPQGKAAEYNKWAVNFYNGCSSDCKYCYLKKYPFNKNWSNTPTLKRTLHSEEEAIQIFRKELNNNLFDLQKHGLFFNFSSDPFLPETEHLNRLAMQECLIKSIPVKFLTKQNPDVRQFCKNQNIDTSIFADTKILKRLIKAGWTLTGCDILEPGAATNSQRLYAMDSFHAHFTTWASIEPVISIKQSTAMIQQTIKLGCCDHYKIGLLSGKKFDAKELQYFISAICDLVGDKATIYWKDDLLLMAGKTRDSLPMNCVQANHNF